MSSLVVGAISTFFIFGGVLLGLYIRRHVPSDHLSGDTRDTIKVGAGVISTLSAIVLGLLVGSAKSSFDVVNSEITQTGAKIMLLNQTLVTYGPESRVVREDLLASLKAIVRSIWHEGTTHAAIETVGDYSGGQNTFKKLIELTPKTEMQKLLHSHAIQMATDLQQTRWLLIEQDQGVLPNPLLVMLLAWLTLLYISFGLLAPRNKTSVLVLLTCSVSVASGLFLIYELNRPLSGVVKISSAAMNKAIERIENDLKPRT